MPRLGATRIVWVALVALQAAWFGWLAPIDGLGRAGGTIVAMLPLLAPLWWIWRLRVNALVIGGLILMGYFCVAVAEAWTTPAVRAPALVEIALIAVYFVALVDVRRGTSGPARR